MKFCRELFEQILRYIEENHFSVTEKNVSEKFNLSRCYLSVLFKKTWGVTFSQYIQNKKMEIARELLCKTEMPLKHIINESGYRSKSAFYRRFKKIYGVPPGLYRYKNQANKG